MSGCDLQDGGLQLLLQQQILGLEVTLLDLIDPQVALEATCDNLGSYIHEGETQSQGEQVALEADNRDNLGGYGSIRACAWGQGEQLSMRSMS